MAKHVGFLVSLGTVAGCGVIGLNGMARVLHDDHYSRWSGDDGRFPEHSIFVLNDSAHELKRLVAVVFLGRDQRLVEDHADQIGGRCLLEFGDEMPGGLQPVLAFRFATNISRLKREVNAPSRGCAPGPAA